MQSFDNLGNLDIPFFGLRIDGCARLIPYQISAALSKKRWAEMGHASRIGLNKLTMAAVGRFDDRIRFPPRSRFGRQGRIPQGPARLETGQLPANHEAGLHGLPSANQPVPFWPF
jgi:hypothetical protein